MFRRALRHVTRRGLQAVLDYLDWSEAQDELRMLVEIRAELDEIHDRVEIMWRELDLDLEKSPPLPPEPGADPTPEAEVVKDEADTEGAYSRWIQKLQQAGKEHQAEAPPPQHSIPHPLAWTIASTLRQPYGQEYPPVGVAFQELSSTTCPSCGARINAVTSWGDVFQPDMPKVCVCGVCAKPFRFGEGENHDLIALTSEEIEKMEPETRQTMEALRMMLNQ